MKLNFAFRLFAIQNGVMLLTKEALAQLANPPTGSTNGATAGTPTSTAVGLDSVASVDAGTSAFGYKAAANGALATAIGSRAQAGKAGKTQAYYDTAIGAKSKAKARSVAIGEESKSTVGSSVTGQGAKASFYSVADGYSSNSFFLSAAVGSKAKSGFSSSAVGTEALANDESESIGYDSYAFDESEAVGYKSRAAQGSSAMGWESKAYLNSVSDGSGAFSYNNSVAVGANANAVALPWVLNQKKIGPPPFGVGNVAVGVNAMAINEFDVAIGASANATMDHSIAVGANSYVHADNSVAVGYLARTVQSNAAVIGTDGSVVPKLNVGINTETPNTKADLTLASTDRGLLLNRVSGLASIVGLGLADAGMVVYNTLTSTLNYWTGTMWASNNALTISAFMQISFVPARRSLANVRGSNDRPKGRLLKKDKKDKKAPKATKAPKGPKVVDPVAPGVSVSYGDPSATFGMPVGASGLITTLAVLLQSTVVAGQIDFFIEVNGVEVGQRLILSAGEKIDNIVFAPPISVAANDVITFGAVPTNLSPAQNAASVNLILQQ